jgi:hypothetical protein
VRCQIVATNRCPASNFRSPQNRAPRPAHRSARRPVDGCHWQIRPLLYRSPNSSFTFIVTSYGTDILTMTTIKLILSISGRTTPAFSHERFIFHEITNYRTIVSYLPDPNSCLLSPRFTSPLLLRRKPFQIPSTPPPR